jgi:hypothetical protein
LQGCGIGHQHLTEQRKDAVVSISTPVSAGVKTALSFPADLLSWAVNVRTVPTPSPDPRTEFVVVDRSLTRC